MYHPDKINVEKDLDFIPGGNLFPGMMPDGELGRFFREAREFLQVSKHLEKKVNEHDERMHQMMERFTVKQWHTLSGEFDVKMGALMIENERRLKDILNLQKQIKRL